MRPDPRHAFTAVELMIVIGIIAMLTGMVVPSIAPAMRRARVAEGASAIELGARQARALALSAPALPAGSFWGVVVDPTAQPQRVALTCGPGAALANIVKDADGKPLWERSLNANVAIFAGDVPASAAIGWCYNLQGFPIQPGAPLVPITIGTTGSPVAAALSVRSQDQRARYAVAIYRVGVAASGAF